MSTTKGIALVTGSAQGIGRSIALRLARDGFDLALNDLPSKRDGLRDVADEIEKIGRRTLPVPADVSVDTQVKGMVENAVKELGGLDVMVANAGIVAITHLISTEVDEWERIMAVNARGAFLCYKYAAQQMIRQGHGGRIIGATSAAGKLGLSLLTTYSMSKFAIRGLTQTAALELGKYNITVNSYAPGAIKTPLLADILGNGGEFAKDGPEALHLWKSHLATRALKYDGETDDVASLVSYLASKEAHFITGQCIVVDGGQVLS